MEIVTWIGNYTGTNNVRLRVRSRIEDFTRVLKSPKDFIVGFLQLIVLQLLLIY